jgi:lipopolysaccharide transport system ATP-binding protein
VAQSPAAIRAEHLSKRYRLGSRERHPTLRFAISKAASAALRRERRAARGPEIWALDDVSVEIPAGDVVGIIGRNGAGKSTLLKVLSRITEPTRGWAEIRGRVGSLLEVGIGFHPELTGRENVFLYGAILGMRKREINRRFDEIVDFAEIDRFLDTPVKRYSSGMLVRIAFAVAAHLETEILLVDEVLAVGDVAFQRKCLGKMGSVAGEGRTVLFVSHNMAVIQALCRRGVFMRDGRVVTDADIDTAVADYLRSLESLVTEDLLTRRDRGGYQDIQIAGVEITNADGSRTLATGAPARFAFHLTRSHPRLACSFTLFNNLGQPIATLGSASAAPGDATDGDGGAVVVCEIDELPLVAGRYRVDVQVRDHAHLQDALEAAAMFDVEQGMMAGRPVAREDGAGDIAIRHRWTLPPAP